MQSRALCLWAAFSLSAVTTGLSQQPGTKLWEFVVGNDRVLQPAIDEDGILYFGAGTGKFYAVDAGGKVGGWLNPTSW